MNDTVKLVLVAHASGFLMGAGFIYLIFRYAKKIFLSIPKTDANVVEHFKEYWTKDQEIRKLNSITRAQLDKLARNG